MIKQGVETVSLPLDFSGFSEIIDVRAPVEFEEDHIPGAINLPVLNNEERAEVGTIYKNDQFAARRRGAALISKRVAGYLENELSDRDRDWAPLVHCWRGGMRSCSMAIILRSIGWRARVLDGGYKAWRSFLREDLARLLDTPNIPIHVLGGLTGSGKTRLLHALREAGAQILDLEGLANHRGSLLGSVGTQPTQKRFETGIYEILITSDLSQPIFLEAESNRIGSVHLPSDLWKKLPTGIVHEVTMPLDQRADYLLEDYQHFPQDPAHLTELLNELRRIRGNDQVDQWQSQIKADDWLTFTRSILEHHYDLAYRRPGAEGSVYQPPTDLIALPDANPDSLASAAKQLIASTS
ncbi:MAG: tRNA 2-selenouridine(34) synthase MnmH [Akkermansiaceae bacterium]|nr:tRNA 2-selenouridine(34) synthase MnmH [Akkermansiaceae bacterium]